MRRWLGVSVIACALIACTNDPECEAAVDCDDGDVCTEDRCRLGLCSHLSITHCCHEARACPNPELPACDMSAAPDAGRCVTCLADDDCTDPAFSKCLPDPPACVECLVDADCSNGGICISFGCMPPPPGGPCTRDEDCLNNWCLLEADTGFPGGYCGEPCNDHPDCATGACIDAGGAGKTCLGPCLPPPDCPPDTYCPPECRPGYMCMPTPGGGGCAPHCTDASHCPAIGACDRWSGLCSPTPPPGAPNGAPCTSDADCRGFCATEAATGAPGGLCATWCADNRRVCPGTDACMYMLGPWAETALVCQPAYDMVSCRPAYAPQIAGLLPTDTPDWDGVPVCSPACQNSDCTSGECDEYTGICDAVPNPTGGDYGDPCQIHADCKRMCLFLWPQGYCTGPCILGGPACPDDAVCMNLGALTSCGKGCATGSDCREPEYACNPTIQACLPP